MKCAVDVSRTAKCHRLEMPMKKAPFLARSRTWELRRESFKLCLKTQRLCTEHTFNRALTERRDAIREQGETVKRREFVPQFVYRHGSAVSQICAAAEVFFRLARQSSAI